jgi:hypothetical protein
VLSYVSNTRRKNKGDANVNSEKELRSKKRLLKNSSFSDLLKTTQDSQQLGKLKDGQRLSHLMAKSVKHRVCKFLEFEQIADQLTTRDRQGLLIKET